MCVPMEQGNDPSLTASERRTLRYIAQGELHGTELDWVAVQRLTRMRLIEEHGSSTLLTKEGQRTLGRISARTR
jgi:hypothetical protein